MYVNVTRYLNDPDYALCAQAYPMWSSNCAPSVFFTVDKMGASLRKGVVLALGQP